MDRNGAEAMVREGHTAPMQDRIGRLRWRPGMCMFLRLFPRE